MATRLKDAIFTDRFPAKVATDTTANRPGSPEGDGDTFYATDDQVLSIGNAGSWDEIPIGGGGNVVVSMSSIADRGLQGSNSA